MKLKIDKGIPIPSAAGSKRNKIMNLLPMMKKGDSFIYPGKSVSNVHTYAKICGIKIVTRSVEGGKHRVWRAE